LGRAVVSGWLDWTTLAPLPDREGFAAPFAGVSGGALLVAGGANFPDRKPWEGGDKVWSDTVFLLDQPSGTWRKAGKLPRPLGYGVSVTTEDGVLCLGGSDAKRHYADAFLLQWSHGQLHRRRMPSLPTPSANMCGALVGTGVYLAGGTDSPVATKALRTFWTLDLAAKRPRWEALEPCPGPARMLAVAGVHGGAFLLFGGVGLHSGADGRPVRTYLRDAWRYTPSAGWQRLADLPRAAAAAPSPAPWRGSRLLIVSGDDGVHAKVEPKSLHPGFPRDVLAYEPRADHWGNLGDSPLSRATVPVVEWQGRAVMANGEVRPGVRSPEVWVLDGR
jgi:N-acetylneuraminic acid mutarotase